MSRANLHRPANHVRVEPHTGALLRLAWQRIREQIYSGVKGDGYDDLNPAHVAMFRFESLDGKRPTQLSEQMQITKQSVHDLVRHLEKCGYAELQPDPADSRARLLRLTPRGRKLDFSVQKHAYIAEKELEKQLGTERFCEFVSTLKLIVGSPEKLTP